VGQISTHINWFPQVLPRYHPHPLKTPTPKKHCGARTPQRFRKPRNEARAQPRLDFNKSKNECDGHDFWGKTKVPGNSASDLFTQDILQETT